MNSFITEIKSYRDLIVWQKSHQLVKLILDIVKKFPDTVEANVLKKQLIRSVFSIPANIAEGYGGKQGNSYRNFMIIARRSATECDYWMFLANDLQYLNNDEYNNIESLLKEVNALLSAIINKLNATKI